MKRILLAAFVLAASVAIGQTVTKVIEVNPAVNITRLDSLTIYSGSKWVRNVQRRTAVTVIDSFHTTSGSAVVSYRGKDPTAADAVASIALLQTVGASSGVNPGVYLLSVATGDTLWTLSEACTRTGSGGNVNSDTLSFWAPAARFTSVRSGMRVTSAVFPWGTAVDTVAADSNGFTVTKSASAAAPAKPIRFDYWTTGAYGTGDAVGLPFVLTDTLGIQGRQAFILQSVVLIDSSKQNAALELVVFDTTFVDTCDNYAFAPVVPQGLRIVGVVPIAAADYYSYGVYGVAVPSNPTLAIKRGPLYGQLVTRGSPTYLSNRALRLKLVFVNQ